MDWTSAIGIVSAIVGGGALLSFIQFLIKRKDDSVLKAIERVDQKIDALEESFDTKISALDRKIDDVEANNARIRILQFSEDSRRHDTKHSKESYDQVHKDIDDYNSHCQKYPDYPNSRAEAAIKNIERMYLEAMKSEQEGKDGFLD